MWWEGTNGADINNRPEWTNHFSFTPTTGAKERVTFKRLLGFDSPAGRWVGVAVLLAAVSEGVGTQPLAAPAPNPNKT